MMNLRPIGTGLDMFLQDCLSESADCETEVEICTTELVERQVCRDQGDRRLGRLQLSDESCWNSFMGFEDVWNL